jgi:hypothetical protein
VQVLVEAAHSCTTALRTRNFSSSSSSTAEEPVVEGAAAKQLFSMLVSCLKAAEQLIDDASSSSSNVDRCDAAGDSTTRADTLAALLAPARVCSTAYGAFKHVGGQQLQLLLRSRCLSIFARLAVHSQHATADGLQAQQQEHTDASADEAAIAVLAGQQLTLMAQMLERIVVDCTQALSDAGLQLPGEPEAAAAALSKLQQQGKSLQEQLRPYTAQPAAPVTGEAHQPASTEGGGSSSSSSSIQAAGTQSQQQQQQRFQGEQAQQLARDVQQFGDAICLQLPVSLWCCNPCCSSVQQHSELELVSGKGSRCSGCAAARFCSRACQQQCWKGQHAPVCKRIAAARKCETKY